MSKKPSAGVGPVNTFMLEGDLCLRVRAFAERENRSFANSAKTLILRGLESQSTADAKWVESVTRKKRRAIEVPEAPEASA